MQKSKVMGNTIMLYIMSIAKLIFPLLTLPYLTRVLSEDTYGFVSYVKSCMTYMQLIIDFGFILSSVKDIVKANGDNEKIGKIAGNTFLAKTMLSIVSAVAMIIMYLFIDILQISFLFVILSFGAVALTSYLADFLFRGIEKMHYITIVYLISKGVAVVLTFVFVKGDSTIIWIPVLDILMNVIAIVISIGIIKKLGIKIRLTALKDCFIMIKDSFTYFLSSVATTVFSALNTLLIGIYISDLAQVAHWSLCLTMISAIQGLYAPICNSVYPHMIQERRLSFIHKILKIFMPLVVVGCGLCIVLADIAMLVVGGEKYVEASDLFRLLVPILLFSFPAQLYGWPTLGAIGKTKETTASTVLSASFQLIGLIVLIVFNCFTLISLAILRSLTELVLMGTRMFITYRNKRMFSDFRCAEAHN
ncbi:MAG: oligosaccharide flippase family protein [Clostridia bacterium]|nr:oligosaccharide flippase family protein [Clostridia bacterium]